MLKKSIKSTHCSQYFVLLKCLSHTHTCDSGCLVAHFTFSFLGWTILAASVIKFMTIYITMTNIPTRSEIHLSRYSDPSSLQLYCDTIRLRRMKREFHTAESLYFPSGIYCTVSHPTWLLWIAITGNAGEYLDIHPYILLSAYWVRYKERKYCRLKTLHQEDEDVNWNI